MELKRWDCPECGNMMQLGERKLRRIMENNDSVTCNECNSSFIAPQKKPSICQEAGCSDCGVLKCTMVSVHKHVTNKSSRMCGRNHNYRIKK